MPEAMEDQSSVETMRKTNYARLFWPTLRGIALIVAMWAFIPFLRVLLYGGEPGIAVPVFAIASFALMAMTLPQERPTAMAGDRAVTAFWHALPWSVVAYGIITGTGFNWVCAFLWFSRRYPVFSGPVVGAMGLLFLFYAAIGLAVGWLTGGNWRKALVISALAPLVLGGIAQRLLR
jgi:hypothetical protein